MNKLLADQARTKLTRLTREGLAKAEEFHLHPQKVDVQIDKKGIDMSLNRFDSVMSKKLLESDSGVPGGPFTSRSQAGAALRSPVKNEGPVNEPKPEGVKIIIPEHQNALVPEPVSATPKGDPLGLRKISNEAVMSPLVDPDGEGYRDSGIVSPINNSYAS